MTNILTVSGEGIFITRIFDAPREAVYDAWTTPTSFAVWFGGPDVDVPIESCKIDAVVGGSWQATMVLPDGNQINWSGEFQEIVFPKRLVLTMKDRPGPNFEPLTIEFRELAGKTEMTFHQFGGNLDTTGYEQAGAGWMIFFDTMERFISLT